MKLQRAALLVATLASFAGYSAASGGCRIWTSECELQAFDDVTCGRHG